MWLRGQSVGVGGGHEWNAKCEFASLAGAVAVCVNRPTMEFDDRLDESESDAKSTLRAIESLSRLHEQVEDAPKHFSSDADSRVVDSDDGLSVADVEFHAYRVSLMRVARCGNVRKDIAEESSSPRAVF